MRPSEIGRKEQLRVQLADTQSARNPARNSWLGTCPITLIYQGFGKRGFARLFNCKAPASIAQFEAKKLDAVIRKNLEVLGYGK